jgi:hypothetical protein
MQQITINVNPSIYEHIMFFLQNLPKNLVDIHFEQDKSPKNITTKKESLRGIFQSYADPKKVSLEKDAWKNHLLDKHKRNLND